MTIGERIKLRREQLGLTQEEVAKKCGYKSRSSVNKIELSRSLPLSKVELMANALETTPAELMGWEDVQEIEYDTEKATIIKNNKNDEEARKLYELYQQANPSIKVVIETLLKGNNE